MDKREPDMVMAPVEPTEAMIAAAERLYDFPLGSSTAINSPAPDAIWSAMLSAAPTPSDGGEPAAWRDIESAPRDGRLLILATPRGVLAGKWGLGRYDRSKKEYERCWVEGVQSVVHPTHWMPLPAAPGVAHPTPAPAVDREPVRERVARIIRAEMRHPETRVLGFSEEAIDAILSALRPDAGGA